MLQAILRGKLSRDHEQMEDILTSNVFGLLRYQHPRVTLDFLARATLIDGKKAFDSELLHSDKVLIDWDFWPYWSEPGCIPCEPDVVLTLTIPGKALLQVLIEAKLNAGKSSRSGDGDAPADQLAREWDNLARRAHASGAQPILVYLTSHFVLPLSEIEASMVEFRAKRGFDPVIAWLSWRELLRVLGSDPSDLIQKDISRLLDRIGLTYFEGIAPLTPAKIQWCFDAASYNWDLGNVLVLDWSFQ